MNAHRRISAAAEQLDEIAQIIGQHNLIRLCQTLGGAKIYVPRLIGHNHPIAAAIGMKAASLLAEHYFGMQIDLPKAHARRERMIEMAESGTMSMADAARACDYTERRLYQLLAERRRAAGESDQLDLFLPSA